MEKPDKKNSSMSPAELLKASLRPGNRVDIVLERDDVEELVVVRTSRLHEVNADHKLVLAQTDPVVGREYVGKKIEVTFLIRVRKPEGPRLIRTGFYSHLTDIVRNYDLGRGLRETVLLLEVPTKLFETNLRMHYRLAAPMGVKMLIVPRDMRVIIDQDLTEFSQKARQDIFEGVMSPEDLYETWTKDIKFIVNRVADAKKPRTANVLDLSTGGAKLSHPADYSFPKDTLLDLTLSWEEFRLDLTAKVVRTGVLDTTGTMNKHFTSVQFVDIDAQTDQDLRKIFAEMARYVLAKRSRLKG